MTTGRSLTWARTSHEGQQHLAGSLFDHQSHLGSATLVGQDLDVLEPDEGLQNLGMVDEDEGVFSFKSHNSILKHLRLLHDDGPRGQSPAGVKCLMLRGSCASRWTGGTRSAFAKLMGLAG